MGGVRVPAFLAATVTVVLLQSFSAAANFTFPFLPPLFGNVCEENVCGKGKCVKSENRSLGFECECEAGWKQARADHDEILKFLPCVIPNCTFNNSCTSDAYAPAPWPPSHDRSNLSIFHPCYWTDCGGGSCNATSPFTRTCLCEDGYHNLFNSTAFPCYKDCSIGLDCKNLGINIANTTDKSNTSRTVADETSNGASMIGRVKLGWLIFAMASLGLAVRI